MAPGPEESLAHGIGLSRRRPHVRALAINHLVMAASRMAQFPAGGRNHEMADSEPQHFFVPPYVGPRVARRALDAAVAGRP